MKATLETTTSADGTSIAFERIGRGRTVILIGGAFNDRTTMTGLAHVLSPDHQAVIYDRRARGDSGDESRDYTVDREIDDLRAVIDQIGGSASLFGHSSGAVLALEAAIRRLPVEKVAAYETPFIPKDSRPRPASDVTERLIGLVKTGDTDCATVLYQTEVIGLPSAMIDGMRHSDMWGYLTRLAPSLPYDYALFEPGCPVPSSRLATIAVPTLAIAGANTFPWLAAATEDVARAVPGARFVSLDGQDHGVLQQPEALHDVLKDFFG